MLFDLTHQSSTERIAFALGGAAAVLAGIAVGAYAPAERVLYQTLVMLGLISLMLPLYVAPTRNRVILLVSSLIFSAGITSVNVAYAPIGPGLTLFFILATRLKNK